MDHAEYKTIRDSLVSVYKAAYESHRVICDSAPRNAFDHVAESIQASLEYKASRERRNIALQNLNELDEEYSKNFKKKEITTYPVVVNVIKQTNLDKLNSARIHYSNKAKLFFDAKCQVDTDPFSPEYIKELKEADEAARISLLDYDKAFNEYMAEQMDNLYYSNYMKICDSI